VRGLLGVLLALALSLAMLTGCELRRETPPPTEPVPDAIELARREAVADADLLIADARDAAAGDPAAVLLEAVALASEAHDHALGGVYVPFPDASPSDDAAAGQATTGEPETDVAPSDGASAGTTASPTPSPGPTTPPTAADVVELATAAALRARTAAEAIEDGPLARLLASIAVSRSMHARTIATAAGLPVTSTALTVPADLPAGLGGSAISALVQSEDGLGLAWEVVAARSDGPARSSAAARAAMHRTAGQAWATAGGLAGTGLDPRRVAYDLPDAILDPATDPGAVTAALATLESGLAQDYATLVAAAAPGVRGSLIDGLADAATVALGLTGLVPAFPGLPEQTGG